MHNLVKLIVYAPDKRTALEKAEKNISSLTGENEQPFDYYDFSGRWSDVCGKPFLADSNKGKELIERAMFDTKIVN